MTLQNFQASKFPVNIEHTINSGQVFLWDKIDDAWWGINGDSVLKVDQKSYKISWYNKNSCIVSDFHSSGLFRDDDDIAAISKTLSKKDIILKNAISEFEGLRIIRQDPFQCLVSFIVSSNSNIRRIRKNLHSICAKFGGTVSAEGREFFVFPQASKLAEAHLSELVSCGLGYRAGYIRDAAKYIADKKIDLEELKRADYETAKDKLIEIPGIGNKVADCILLFSLEKLDAFPLDRWMIHVLKKYYSGVIDTSQIKDTLTQRQYDKLHQGIVSYFGEYCGYAQQFLFKMERELNHKSWASSL